MEFYSHGKVLLTAEYAVLEGVKALALPTQKGQSLEIVNTTDNCIHWKSYTRDKQSWIDLCFDANFNCISAKDTSHEYITSVQQLLNCLNELSPTFYGNGCQLITQLEFPRDWGLGSSSTLINNLAQWLKLNPYELLDKTMGGSGYDIAAAQHSTPIFYERNGYYPKVTPTSFSPIFKEHLFFVHLNQKQNSRNAIANYRQKRGISTAAKLRLASIGEELLIVKTLDHFNTLIEEHELITAAFLQQTPVKKARFSDFKGAVKSLGAWGGDFVLVTGSYHEAKAYFESKGYATLITYKDFILG